jgi:hypothetical protein
LCEVEYKAGEPNEEYRWHHIAITFDEHKKQTYLDGVLNGPDATGAPPEDFLKNEGTVVIGSQGNRFLKGLVDEVRIYDRVLPSSEIEAMVGRQEPLVEAVPAPVAPLRLLPPR